MLLRPTPTRSPARRRAGALAAPLVAALVLLTAGVAGLAPAPTAGADGVPRTGQATATPPPPQANAGTTYTFGTEPMSDVVYWAGQEQAAACSWPAQ